MSKNWLAVYRYCHNAMDKLDPLWFLKLSPLYLTSNNQVQSPRPERCKDIGLEVTNALCVQIKVYLNSVRAVSLLISIRFTL